MRYAPTKHPKRLYLVIVRFSRAVDREQRFRDSGTFETEKEAKRFADLYSGDNYQITMTRYERASWPASRKRTAQPSSTEGDSKR